MANNWRSRLGTMFPTLSQFTEDARGIGATRQPVLVIGTDDPWLDEYAAMLRTLGHEPLVARTRGEAVALLLSHDVRIALVDMGTSGAEAHVARDLALGAELDGRRLHLLIMADLDAGEPAAEVLEAIDVDLLAKPVRLGALREALRSIDDLPNGPTTLETLVSTVLSLRDDIRRLSDQRAIEPRDEEPTAATLSSALALPMPDHSATGRAALASHIRDILRSETKRRSIGGADVFGDPAWEMLLDLLLATIEGRTVSVSSACIASGAPMSTALRLVGRLVEDDVLQKIPDRTDRRRHFLVINTRFEQPLINYLSEQLRGMAER